MLVTGPESSGTSLVANIFTEAGADVAHRSATYDDGWTTSLGVLARECDAVVAVFRDPFVTMQSQRAQGAAEPEEKLRRAYHRLFGALRGLDVPLYILTYEQLVLNKHSIKPILRALGLNAGIEIEHVRDENYKYYCG